MTNTKKTEATVKVLPAGEASGARDLQVWAKRRMNGQSGVPSSQKEYKQLRKKQKLAKHGRRRK